MRKLKICLFGTYFYSYSRNSILRKGFKENGITIVEVHADSAVVSLQSNNDLGFRKIFSHILEKIRIAARLLKESHTVLSSDIIVVLYPGYVILPLAWILARVSRKILIFDAFTSVYDTVVEDRKLIAKNSLKAKILKQVEMILLKLPNKLFVDTDLMKQYVQKQFHVKADRIFVVPVGADDTMYTLSRKKKTNKTVQVVWFGGYTPLQGADYIIQAAKLLAKSTAVHFTFIGRGGNKKELMEYTKKSKLPNVTFLAQMPETKLVRHLQAADIVLGIFANNSLARRVIPNKVYAGIASKKAVITAKLPAFGKEFVDNTNIIYTKPENPSDLANKVLMVAKDAALRRTIAANGYAVYQKYFTPKKIAHVFLSNI